MDGEMDEFRENWMRLGYARTSTGDQHHDLQLDALRAAGCERIVTEVGSGSRSDRAELAKLLEQARSGDVLVVWRLDRLGRSLRHLIELSDQLQQRGIGLHSLSESIDTTTVSGRFLFHVLGALGQVELEILRDRTRAGLRAAALRGRRGGRPPALDEAQIRAARAMLRSGDLTAAEVARQLGVSPSTLYRHIVGGKSALDTAA